MEPKVTNESGTISHIIGIDLGGTNLRLRLTTDTGTPIAEHRMVHEGQRASDFVPALVQAIEQLCDEHKCTGPLRIGFAIAAMLDPGGTIVQNAPNLGWRDVHLVSLLAETLKRPHETRLFNDLDAAAYGEYAAGAGQGARHLACVFVGSGVGAGLIIDGKLHAGASRVAGEFGHMKVVATKGRRCGCGADGCLEAYVGGHSLAHIAAEAAPTSPFLTATTKAIRAGAKNNLGAAALEAGAAAGDPTCLAIWDQTASYLGLALANMLTLLNPDRLILGGGLLGNTPLLYNAVLQVLREHTNPPALQALTTKRAELGDDAGLTGAVGLMSFGSVVSKEHGGLPPTPAWGSSPNPR